MAQLDPPHVPRCYMSGAEMDFSQ
eukprot:COSAG01_NODE_68759_length_263_cov_0.634146_1_plen_23_part_10